MSDEEIVLEPCPFCGEDRVYTIEGEYVDDIHSIECINSNCGAEIKQRSKQKAIAAWNRRARR